MQLLSTKSCYHRRYNSRKYQHECFLLKPYSTLTRRGRARRLRQVAINALRLYDLDVDRLRLLTNSFNCIFRIDTHAGEKYVLRVSLPEGAHTLDSTRGEMTWLAALSRDTDLSVPVPLATRNGDLVVEVEGEGVPERRMCTIFGWVPGINLYNRLSLENMTSLGSLMARLHVYTNSFQIPKEWDVPRYDSVFYFDEPVILFDEKYSDIITPERRRIYQEGLDFAQTAIERLQASDEPMRIIHNDLHGWNVRIQNGVLSPIDFEDLVWGWPVQDIGTAMFYFMNERYTELLQAFRHGYTQICPWPERYPGEINAFIASRGLMLMNFTLTEPDIDWRSYAPRQAEKLERFLLEILYP